MGQERAKTKAVETVSQEERRTTKAATCAKDAKHRECTRCMHREMQLRRAIETHAEEQETLCASWHKESEKIRDFDQEVEAVLNGLT